MNIRVSLMALGLALALPLATAEAATMSLNFCPTSRSTFVSYAEVAGLEYSSVVEVPVSNINVQSIHGYHVGVYVKNLGPGSIRFVLEPEKNLGAWSVFGNGLATAFRGTAFGEDLDRNAWTKIPLTPRGGEAYFNDAGWGGQIGENVEMLGCTFFKDISIMKKQGNAHLDLSFLRNGELHTVRINFKFR